MRRKDKEIVGRAEIDAILRNFEPLAVARVRTWKITIAAMTGKRSQLGKTA
jgi:hypothetical protein